MGSKYKALTFFSLLCLLVATSAQPCGPEGKLCAKGQCCSIFGVCGTGFHCYPGICVSQCPTLPIPPPPPASPTPPPPSPPPPPPCDGISCIVNRSIFYEILPRLVNDSTCLTKDFYSYEAFTAAARYFPQFGNTGDIQTRKRDIAAFFAQTSTQSVGYCIKEQGANASSFCVPSQQFPCVPGKRYNARGPITYGFMGNIKYGMCGKALGLDLLTCPEVVVAVPSISIASAVWYWMTPQDSMPSSHDVMVGNWVPSPADIEEGRFPGFGLTTHILSPWECGESGNPFWPALRAAYYRRYCEILGVRDIGGNLTCENQAPFRTNLFVDTK